MAKIVYDVAIMKFMHLFELLTHARLKDCIINPSNPNQVIFVVQENEIAKAIGRGGVNVKKLENKIKKHVKIVEFSPDRLQFIKNLVAPLELTDIEIKDDGTIVLTAKDLKTRGLLIGRDASNLRSFEAIVQRYFPVKELRVK